MVVTHCRFSFGGPWKTNSEWWVLPNYWSCREMITGIWELQERLSIKRPTKHNAQSNHLHYGSAVAQGTRNVGEGLLYLNLSIDVRVSDRPIVVYLPSFKNTAKPHRSFADKHHGEWKKVTSHKLTYTANRGNAPFIAHHTECSLCSDV